MIEEATQDVTQRVDMLMKLVYNSMRLQTMTMRLIVQGLKDLSDQTKNDLLASINKIEKAAEEGIK